jgi:putative thioredoxin
MQKLNYVFDASGENFQQLVVENSRKGLVLANYWTPRAGPCFKLWQALEALSREFEGRFLLVNINTETQKRLARENGITSVPTVKIYRNGRVVESIHGAHSEASLRATINQHVPAARPAEVIRAIHTYQAGHAEDALKILVNAAIKDPDNPDVHTTAVRLLLREGRYADIEAYIAQLPDALKTLPDIDTMRTHARLLHLAAGAPAPEQLDALLEREPDNRAAALRRIALAITGDDYQTAFDALTKQLKTATPGEREFLNKVMLALFNLLGEDSELTRRFRRLYLNQL